jgi:hypothetical protein
MQAIKCGLAKLTGRRTLRETFTHLFASPQAA